MCADSLSSFILVSISISISPPHCTFVHKSHSLMAVPHVTTETQTWVSQPWLCHVCATSHNQDIDSTCARLLQQLGWVCGCADYKTQLLGLQRAGLDLLESPESMPALCPHRFRKDAQLCTFFCPVFPTESTCYTISANDNWDIVTSYLSMLSSYVFWLHFTSHVSIPVFIY